MTEYDEVVHVETLEEYLAVLDKWFDKGYDWSTTLRSQDHHEEYFNRSGARYLTLDANRKIGYSFGLAIDKTKAMSFKEFMAKELGEVTYEVSEEQLAFLNDARDSGYPASYLRMHSKEYGEVLDAVVGYGATFERDVLKYVAGDENVVFKVKGPLYMLKGKDSDGDTVYFTLDGVGAPTYVYDDEKSDAFKAPFEQIEEWANRFWKIEPVTD